MRSSDKFLFWLALGLIMGILFICPACQTTSPSTTLQTPTTTPLQEEKVDCSTIESLPVDSPAAYQIVEDLIRNYKEQQPTEYMGMAILHRVDRLGAWAIIQGSISGEGKDIIVVQQTDRGYQLAERYTITVPLESFDEPEEQLPRYFMEKLPEAPDELFTCLEQGWLLGHVPAQEPQQVYQLAFVGTSDATTGGTTEIHTLQSDGSNQNVLLTQQMLITGLDSSPDGERIVFWGCPGSLATDCSPDEDLDVWVVNWDGSNLINLTEDSFQSDNHPDWSPDSYEIVFDSDRAGNSQLYLTNLEGTNLNQLTNDAQQNTEPKWSPDGKWIAYHCSQDGETRICIISPEGQPAGEPLSGTMPVWSSIDAEGIAQLAFLCFQDGHSDVCTARPDGSEIVNLTNSPAGEHSPAWSPDGSWLAFVSNKDEDIDVYKICVTCPGDAVIVRLTDEAQPASWPAWSPDGAWLAYVVGQDLMRVNEDRSGVSFLTGGVFGPPIWRP